MLENKSTLSLSWKPSALGRLITSAPSWLIRLDREEIFLKVRDKEFHGNIREFHGVSVESGLFWSKLTVPVNDRSLVRLDGIPNDQAQQLRTVIAEVNEAIRYREEVANLIRRFDQAAIEVLSWVGSVVDSCEQRLKQRGWLSMEFISRLNAEKPKDLIDLLKRVEVLRHFDAQPSEVRQAVDFWKRPLEQYTDELNQAHAKRASVEDSRFFDTVEKSPLTQEQREAVICFDNRVLLVASAGSGKTSTMVAKAGYALEKGYFAADKMLLLAFNNDAAAQLRERIKTRLDPLGLPADGVVAKTFHAFGLDIIGAATGKKPSLAPWLEGGKDLEALLQMVDDLKDSDSDFRTNWDLFRVVFGHDLPKFGKEQDNPDSWDSQNRRGGFRTLNNEVVKSRGELLIANWFFYNGVRYVYEGTYEHETADAKHRQYLPDFYIPEAKAYLEHWAVDANGESPAEFIDYKEGMAWKRKVHARYGTRLLETTMAGLWDGHAFTYLTKELTKLGVVLDPNPERPVPGRQPIENPRLARTFRSFLTHTKSNRLTPEELRNRLNEQKSGDFRFRHEMFLRLFEKLWGSWEKRLQTESVIDFEDMLNLATDHVENGQWQSPYELIMVDEFQDASQARARMVGSLMRGQDRHLFAVGDDWQSINRFAGADLAVMTRFDETFGKSITLRLETTFRCPQSLCDISSRFVRRNPSQISKKVRSSRTDVENPVRITAVEDDSKIKSAVTARVNELAKEAMSSRKKMTVYLLGRYQKDAIYLPAVRSMPWLEVSFVTVHSSKGLEADHVILPKMTSETLGFPSQVADDPVLQLAMPCGDDYEFSEERRLFYVALTRAKSTVNLITVTSRKSAFISELVKDQHLEIFNLEGVEISSQACPCGKGFLIQRSGKFGSFLGCSEFPRCSYTRNIENAMASDVLNRPGNRGGSLL